MDILRRVGAIVGKYYSIGDPHSKSLSYFFKVVAAGDIEQRKRYDAYANFPQLKKFLKPVWGKKYLLRFDFKNATSELEYRQIRQILADLHLIHP